MSNNLLIEKDLIFNLAVLIIQIRGFECECLSN